MPATQLWLAAFAQALADEVLQPLAGMNAIEKQLVEAIPRIHARLAKELPSTERRGGLAQLMRMPTAMAEAQVQDALVGLKGVAQNGQKILGGYLMACIAMARQRSRRLDDPKGHKFPGSWTLEAPEDLLGLMPTRAIRYSPGQKLGSYTLLRLLGADGAGECWKATRTGPENTDLQAGAHGGDDEELEGTPPVTVRVILKESVVERVRLAKTSLRELADAEMGAGMARLHRVKFAEHGALLVWDYVEGVPFHGGQALWELPDGRLDAPRLARWIRRTAQALVPLHSLPAPQAHGGLCPASIHFTQSDGKWRIRVLDIGWAAIDIERHLRLDSQLAMRRLVRALKHHGAWRPLYASPLLAKGQSNQPADDIFALGLIWYQGVMGSWELAAPVSLNWLDRALDRGLSSGHGRILSRCLSPDISRRFTTASELVEELLVLETEKEDRG